MIKRLPLGISLLMFLATAVYADTTLKKVVVNLAVGTGVNSAFDATTGTLTWSAGASGYLFDTDGSMYTDNNVNVTGYFSNAIDTSSGGQAMANFQLDSVTLTFNSIEFPSVSGSTSQAVFQISSCSNNRYWESELAADADVLHGQALVNVAATFFLEPLWGAEFAWDGTDGVSCLDSMTSLTYGADFQNYMQNYLAQNNTIVLYADQSNYAVPEPCTLAVMSLGGIILTRRRRLS